MGIKEEIFDSPLRIVNIGLMGFYESVKAQNVTCVHVDWRPPAGGNEKLMEILARLQKKA